MVSFADLSHHQEDVTAATDVDLAAYARAGHDRIAVKASQGLTFIDPWFGTWWEQAGRLGLARVAYHFAQAGQNGAAEFDRFLSVVNGAGGLGPRDALCLDIEDVSSAAAQVRADEYCREFTARAAARGVQTGLVYTGRWYAEPNNIRADDVAPGWRRLWISDYGPAADSAIRLPSGWTRDQVAARQYGSAVKVTGVRTPCDYSRVLNDWLTAAPPTEEDYMTTPLSRDNLLAIRQEVITALNDPTHQYLQDELAPLKTALASQAAQIASLAALVQAGGGLDAAQARQIALDAAREAVDGITITVHGEATS